MIFSTGGRAAALVGALVFSAVAAGAGAEAAPSRAAAPAKPGVENDQNTVAIISGTPAGTSLQFAYDLSAVLDTPQGVRVLPMLGKGGAQNIRDVLALKGVDMGIAQTTDLARMKAEQPDLANRLVYIAKLYNEESGSDFATWRVPIAPAPPPIFSTITFCPSAAESSCATMRASASVGPPAA
jgi:hypothetical protein